MAFPLTAKLAKRKVTVSEQATMEIGIMKVTVYIPYTTFQRNTMWA